MVTTQQSSTVAPVQIHHSSLHAAVLVVKRSDPGVIITNSYYDDVPKVIDVEGVIFRYDGCNIVDKNTILAFYSR